MYTPEQVLAMADEVAQFRRSPKTDVTLAPRIELMLRSLAATLKAAQGRVTEAGYVFVCSNPACRAVHIRDPRGFCPACVAENGSGWSTTRQRLYRDGPERYSTEEEGEAFMDGWYDGQAALSAQQGQGEAVVVGEVAGGDPRHDGRHMLYVMSAHPVEVGTKLYTAPPAQPAERGPEGFLTIGTRVLWEDSIGRKWPATITGYNPATYNAELDDGTDALGYARGRFTVDAASPALAKFTQEKP